MDRNELLKLYGGDELHPIELENSISGVSRDIVIRWAQNVVRARNAAMFDRYDFADNVNLDIFTLPEGKLPKRVRTYLHKQYNVKLTKEESKALTTICAEIGRICSNNHETFMVHVGRRCFWQENSFGDAGSCWFDNKRYHINQMHESPDFAAFTVYKKDRGEEIKIEPGLAHPEIPAHVGGVGRMWLWFDRLNPNHLAAVSAYGLPSEKMIQILMKMMPGYTNFYGARVDYPYVEGYNRGLYDNGGYFVWPLADKKPGIIHPTFLADAEKK